MTSDSESSNSKITITNYNTGDCVSILGGIVVGSQLNEREIYDSPHDKFGFITPPEVIIVFLKKCPLQVGEQGVIAHEHSTLIHPT